MQVLDLAKESEPACRVGVGERRQEQPPEQAGKHLHRQEKAGLAAHPAGPVERYQPGGGSAELVLRELFARWV